jgi:hypothetical protein
MIIFFSIQKICKRKSYHYHYKIPDYQRNESFSVNLFHGRKVCSTRRSKTSGEFFLFLVNFENSVSTCNISMRMREVYSKN